MSEPAANDDGLRNMSREEMMSALFAHLVIQNTNMALMLLGQAPHPESGERIHDAEAARLFIDQLEMLEVKTKGNLSREEEKLLQQSLTHLRLTFVQALDKPASPEPEKKTEGARAAAPATEEARVASGSDEGESRKRFSKKF
jgi:hypothetical protein